MATTKMDNEFLKRAKTNQLRRSIIQECEIDNTIENAKSGDPESQYQLGKMYEQGLNGIKKDIEEAIKWYSLSAKKGNPSGLNAFGLCCNLIEDYESSKKMFSKSN